ncbi:malto-oligosyltrehalose trehalohydrolase [Deinococcus peraridilitoris]|nr:malto-oligosyltrehalose trehalohydrolase [Deinococcus peraridilitoris]
MWSTRARSAGVVLLGEEGEVLNRHPLQARGGGVFETKVEGVGVGTRYKFEVDGQAFPDPYARFLPEGVHGPAVVWENRFEFRHASPKLRADELVIYEMHVGTFTEEGTYRAAAEKLPFLKDLGVNCLELLPVSSFPGTRGWGYDGVAHFAPYKEYGSPEQLQAFIDRAHELGFVVLLDMVYNHFGPDGNYLGAYSPEYFTDRHKTPWGDGLDYSNPFMRHLVLDSAEHWLREYRFDGFRLDATQDIQDDSEKHVLRELAEHVHALGGGHFLFCEDYRNSPHLVTEFGTDGIWADDFHHQVRVTLTGEQDSYYSAFTPGAAGLARLIERGWLYEGQQWPLENEHLEGGRRGQSAGALRAENFVYFIQNHDQIGNRALGDRLPETAGLEGYLTASALLLFLPMTPLLFQGQEWAASTPFQFFSDHHGELGQLVSQGRLSEFGHFAAFQGPEMQKKIPDPQAESTFVTSKLNWNEIGEGEHARTLELYRALLALRREDPVLRHASRGDLQAGAVGNVLWVRRWHDGQERVLLANFGQEEATWPQVPDAGMANLSPMLSTQELAPGRLAPRSTVILGGARG